MFPGQGFPELGKLQAQPCVVRAVPGRGGGLKLPQEGINLIQRGVVGEHRRRIPVSFPLTFRLGGKPEGVLPVVFQCRFCRLLYPLRAEAVAAMHQASGTPGRKQQRQQQGRPCPASLHRAASFPSQVTCPAPSTVNRKVDSTVAR